MLVLRSNRAFFERIYLLNSKKRSTFWRYVKITLFVPLELILVLSAIVYFVQNIRNLQEATESMYAITSFR